MVSEYLTFLFTRHNSTRHFTCHRDPAGQGLRPRHPQGQKRSRGNDRESDLPKASMEEALRLQGSGQREGEGPFRPEKPPGDGYQTGALEDMKLTFSGFTGRVRDTVKPLPGYPQTRAAPGDDEPVGGAPRRQAPYLPSEGHRAMVKVSREASGPGPIQPLNLPMPVEVVEDEHQRPSTLTLRGRTLRIKSIDDLWEISDEWWRTKPIARRYYQLTTQDGRCLTFFRDLVDGGWYCQRG